MLWFIKYKFILSTSLNSLYFTSQSRDTRSSITTHVVACKKCFDAERGLHIKKSGKPIDIEHRLFFLNFPFIINSQENNANVIVITQHFTFTKWLHSHFYMLFFDILLIETEEFCHYSFFLNWIIIDTDISFRCTT